jgi:hypothetical protein
MIEDRGHITELMSSAEAMNFIPHKTKKDVILNIMDRQHSNRWAPFYCICRLHGT